MRWDELRSDIFSETVAKLGKVCLVPLACNERHAHHLPLGTDMFIARDLCRRTVELEPAVIFPDVIFTQILEARHYPGTIALPANLIFGLLENICREIARNGFEKIVLVSTHGGNYHFLRFFAQSQLASPRNYVVYIADPELLPDDQEKINSQWETTVDGHAGEQETSMILAIRPDLTALQTLPQDGEGMPLNRLSKLAASGIYTGIWWYADYPTHYSGDGRPASAEKGERYLAARARALAAAVKLIKEDAITQKLQDEFFKMSK